MSDIPEPTESPQPEADEPVNDLNEIMMSEEEELQEPAEDENRRAWLTPVLALVMLAVGLFLGYAGRPYVQPLLAGKAEATQLAGATQEAGLPSVNSTLAPGEPTPTLMEFLISNTQHFKGDADAPITMIEFSDYQ